MTENEKRLYRQLHGSDSMELLPGGQVSQSAGVNASINQIVGNPAFKAEISIQVFIRYFTDAVANTPGTPAAAGAPPAAQQGNLPIYLFGNIDFIANYARARQLVPGQGAVYGWGNSHQVRIGEGMQRGYIQVGAVAPLPYPYGSVWFGNTLPGDLLFMYPMAPFVAANVADSWRAEVIIRCPNVPYLSLLAALASDTFSINMIRYVVPVATIAQLGQQITLIRNSLFGKTSTDTLDPQTFITPGTFQPQIADVPINLPMDKNLVLATQAIYPGVVAVPAFTWTVTVASINKLVA